MYTVISREPNSATGVFRTIEAASHKLLSIVLGPARLELKDGKVLGCARDCTLYDPPRVEEADQLLGGLESSGYYCRGAIPDKDVEMSVTYTSEDVVVSVILRSSKNQRSFCWAYILNLGDPPDAKPSRPMDPLDEDCSLCGSAHTMYRGENKSKHCGMCGGIAEPQIVNVTTGQEENGDWYVEWQREDDTFIHISDPWVRSEEDAERRAFEDPPALFCWTYPGDAQGMSGDPCGRRTCPHCKAVSIMYQGDSLHCKYKPGFEWKMTCGRCGRPFG